MNDFLFVCTANMLRSPTAEHVARLHGYAADSAGTWAGAVRVLTPEAIARASYIVCMHEEHLSAVRSMVPPCRQGDILVFNIPDKYDYCQPELVEIIGRRLKSMGFRPNIEYPTRG